jgi:copper(I)-binding protein
VAAGYLVIENGGARADRLTGARSPVAETVTLHETVERDGVASMRPLAGGLTVPPGGRVQLAPGGAHFMLNRLAQPLRQGDAVPLTLVFETAGDVTVDFAVLPIGARDMTHRHGAQSHSADEEDHP